MRCLICKKHCENTEWLFCNACVIHLIVPFVDKMKAANYDELCAEDDSE
jgi:hypothetical protein